MTQRAILLVGGTGRTGKRVLQQLLDRGISVRAIVRSRDRLPPEVRAEPGLTVIEANLLSLSNEELGAHARGCDAVISCLGHVISLKGVFGPPRDLVTRATRMLCDAVEMLEPATPMKLILMSSVSVHRPDGLDTRRGRFERAFMWLLRGLVPPASDNQRAADDLHDQLGPHHSALEWVAVRPDSLLEGEVSEYTLHEGLISSLFRPDSTNMANVAHFMCELATNPDTWEQWKGKLPVIVNATPAHD